MLLLTMFVPFFALLCLSVPHVHSDDTSHAGNTHTFFSPSYSVHLAARCKRQISQSSACILTPQATEGPYYWNATIRQNITLLSTYIHIFTYVFAYLEKAKVAFHFGCRSSSLTPTTAHRWLTHLSIYGTVMPSASTRITLQRAKVLLALRMTMRHSFEVGSVLVVVAARERCARGRSRSDERQWYCYV
jgi:hypothetical protein